MGYRRQQLKWFTYFALLAIGSWGFVDAADLKGRLSGLVWAFFTTVSFWTIPAAIGIAILRYRLYDIDRLINRTLVYGLLTAVLGAIYAGVVLVGGQLFGGIGDQPPSWAVAGATLAVAALFQPARRRIQHAVDQRLKRRRYDAARTIEAFRGRLRDEIDLDQLSAELLAVVDQTMEPISASLWLRPSPAGWWSPGTTYPSVRQLWGQAVEVCEPGCEETVARPPTHLPAGRWADRMVRCLSTVASAGCRRRGRAPAAGGSRESGQVSVSAPGNSLARAGQAGRGRSDGPCLGT